MPRASRRRVAPANTASALPTSCARISLPVTPCCKKAVAPMRPELMVITSSSSTTEPLAAIAASSGTSAKAARTASSNLPCTLVAAG